MCVNLFCVTLFCATLVCVTLLFLRHAARITPPSDHHHRFLCMCLRERAQDVSVDYIDAEKGLPILFEFAVGGIDRGCPLSFVSQFPGEDEILIPPFPTSK